MPQHCAHPRDTNLDMRVLVAGDRYRSCNEPAFAIIRGLVERHGRDIAIVHGEASGVDESSDLAAEGLGVKAEPHPADRDRFGRGAGPRRNRGMIDSGVDMCIALHRSLATSKGTNGCVRLAIEAGIPVYLVDSWNFE